MGDVFKSQSNAIKLADNLRKSLFWDVDYDKLDTEKDIQFIIGRVLDYGNLKEWKFIKQLYGESRVVNIAREHIFSDPRSANFWALIFSIPTNQLKCTRNPLLKIPNAFSNY